jgi:hypothetical protein
VTAHPGTGPLAGGALTHGFQIAFYVLAGIATVGALVAALLTEPRRPSREAVRDDLLMEAA